MNTLNRSRSSPRQLKIVRTREQHPDRNAAFLPSHVMNEELGREPPTGTTGITTPEGLLLDDAAEALGVDSFTMLSLIQRGRINPTRSPSGEITVPTAELAMLTKKGG
jgi:hypothetical protein